MKTEPNTDQERILSARELSVVQDKVAKWLIEQNKNGEFESSWTDGRSIVGGGYMNVNSSEELAKAVFG